MWSERERERGEGNAHSKTAFVSCAVVEKSLRLFLPPTRHSYAMPFLCDCGQVGARPDGPQGHTHYQSIKRYTAVCPLSLFSFTPLPLLFLFFFFFLSHTHLHLLLFCCCWSLLSISTHSLSLSHTPLSLSLSHSATACRCCCRCVGDTLLCSCQLGSPFDRRGSH